MDKVSKSTYIIAAFAFLIIVGAIYFLFIFQKKPSTPQPETSQSQIKDVKDIPLDKRPIVTLTPTTDGVSINLRATNMSYFDRIDYEVTYQADNPQIPGQKIARGSTGTITDTKAASHGDELLLGTGSKGVRSPDTGITDGKLVLHMIKGQTEYDSQTSWNLVKADIGDVAQTNDSKFKFTLPFNLSYWTIVQDTVGVPSQDTNQDKFDIKNVVLPTYGAFSVTPQFTKPADVEITLNQGVANPVVYFYNHTDKTWQKLDSKYDGSTKTITMQTKSFGIFVVVSSK